MDFDWCLIIEDAVDASADVGLIDNEDELVSLTTHFRYVDRS